MLEKSTVLQGQPIERLTLFFGYTPDDRYIIVVIYAEVDEDTVVPGDRLRGSGTVIGSFADGPCLRNDWVTVSCIYGEEEVLEMLPHYAALE